MRETIRAEGMRGLSLETACRSWCKRIDSRRLAVRKRRNCLSSGWKAVEAHEGCRSDRASRGRWMNSCSTRRSRDRNARWRFSLGAIWVCVCRRSPRPDGGSCGRNPCPCERIFAAGREWQPRQTGLCAPAKCRLSLICVGQTGSGVRFPRLASAAFVCS